MQVFQMIFSFIICVTVCLAISSSTDLMVRSFDGSFIWFFIHLFLCKFFKINKNLTSLDSRNSLRYYCSSKEHLIYPSFFKILKPVIKNSQYHWRIGVQHKNRGAIEIQIYWNTDLLKLPLMGQYHQNEKELLMLPIPQHHYVHRVKQFCTKQPDHNELTFSNYLKDVQFKLYHCKNLRRKQNGRKHINWTCTLHTLAYKTAFRMMYIYVDHSLH